MGAGKLFKMKQSENLCIVSSLKLGIDRIISSSRLNWSECFSPIKSWSDGCFVQIDDLCLGLAFGVADLRSSLTVQTSSLLIPIAKSQTLQMFH